MQERITRRDAARLLAAGGLISTGSAAAEVSKGQTEIAKAMQSVEKAMPLAESDPERPVYHFHAPAQWMNDPNATLFYKGWHHAFYQLNPYGAEWGHMHWGHARSRDLMNWQHLPIALAPSLEKGEEHVFSGAAITGPDSKPRIFYTSIGKREPEQWMAMPEDDDLIAWRKYPGNPVMKIEIHGGRSFADWRDPFLVQEGERTYMVCGGNWNNRARGGSGVVQFYEATKPDLTAWKHRGPLFEYHDADVINIECPNLIRLEKKWLLLMSPHRPCEYFAGDLNLSAGQFLMDAHGVVDPGDSYASNVSVDDKGRTILWLWGKTFTDPAKGWNGCFALPRLVSVDSSGLLRQQPVPEVEKLRGEAQVIDAADLNSSPLRIGESDCAEIRVTLRAGDAAKVGLRLRGGHEISFDRGSGVLTSGTARKLLGVEQPLRLRVFVDKGVVEVFANDGQAAIFTAIRGKREGNAIEAWATGGTARMEECTVWPMRAAEFDRKQFRA